MRCFLAEGDVSKVLFTSFTFESSLAFIGNAGSPEVAGGLVGVDYTKVFGAVGDT